MEKSNTAIDDKLKQIKIVENLETKQVINQEKIETNHNMQTQISKKRSKKPLLVAAAIFFVILIILLFTIGLPALSVYAKVQTLIDKANSLKKSVASQDIGQVKKNLDEVKTGLTDMQNSYQSLKIAKSFPLIGSFVTDGEHLIKAGFEGIEAANISINTIEPYADIIGLKGSSLNKAKSGEENANDRIDFVVKTISDISPKLDLISEKAKLAKSELDKIDTTKYPENFRGTAVRSKLSDLISLVDTATKLLDQGKPLIKSAPFLLGINSPRTYLVIFQNDKELRPTGGFITAYSVMKVDKGKIQPVASNDIYNLDANYKPKLPAPAVIIKYIKGPYILSQNLRLRDMNFNPDFKVAMDDFTNEIATVGIKNIDGVIAVDTQVLVKLLEVIGEIGVPGFGNFSNKIIPECNCPQVIHELESFADVEGPIIWDPLTGKIILKPAHSDNRKAIVGPLMNSVLRNALGQPKNKLPDLVRVGFESVNQKHVLFYFFDKNAQKGAEAFNIAGRIQDFNGDYLYIVDANLGGRKSNLYITQEVVEDIQKSVDGQLTKTLTITYKNPQSYDGWLNSVLPNWTRIYVPKGSELISTDGFTDKGDTYEEFGKTVFSGGFQLRPQGVVKLTIKYKLPKNISASFSHYIQKQPGTDSPLYSLNYGKNKQEFYLLSDKEINLSF